MGRGKIEHCLYNLKAKKSEMRVLGEERERVCLYKRPSYNRQWYLQVAVLPVRDLPCSRGSASIFGLYVECACLMKDLACAVKQMYRPCAATILLLITPFSGRQAGCAIRSNNRRVHHPLVWSWGSGQCCGYLMQLYNFGFLAFGRTQARNGHGFS